MLDSLAIKNYRNLKELRINSLGRVNLLTGKNNTGKSAILEAIAIYATKGDLGFIYELLRGRGEVKEGAEGYRIVEAGTNATEANINTLSSLFTNRVVGFNREDAIAIGSLDKTEESVVLRFVKFFNKHLEGYEIRIEIGNGKRFYHLDKGEGKSYRLRFDTLLRPQENFQFIRTRDIDGESNGKLWDSIILTEKEKYVIEGLKIIELKTERIAFTDRGRTAVIKLADSNPVVPLRSMGDGINRVLTIILALVNADNGFLLIDEFENGLHHTVQQQLWKIIFTLSEKLNVQVFATTHSEDCISGFEAILNEPNNAVDGKLIRLDSKNGSIQQVEYNAEELKIANKNHIETR